MLKWVDVTSKRKSRIVSSSLDDTDGSILDVDVSGSVESAPVSSCNNSNRSSELSVGSNSISSSDEESDTESAEPRTSTPVYYRKRIRRKDRQYSQHRSSRQRVNTSSQLYVSPEHITLAWGDNQTNDRTGVEVLPCHERKRLSSSTALSKSSDNLEDYIGNGKLKPEETDTISIASKSELLQISTKRGDKSRPSFWKSLIGKSSWPSRSYKSSIYKTGPIVETYRKIEESYYLDPTNTSPSTNATYATDTNKELINAPSIKTIKKHNEIKKPKASFVRRLSGGRSRTPERGFTDLRLSMSNMDILDYDSLIPPSPSLSNTSSEDYEQSKTKHFVNN